MVNAGYAQYVTQLADSIGDSSSPAGQPASIRWFYRGPCINCDPNAPTSSLLTQDQAIAAVFAWFNTIGGVNSTPTRDASIPGFNTQILANSLKSPNVREYTVGFGTALGTRGVAKVDFIYRNWDDFYTTRTDLGTGKVGPNQFGQTLDLNLVVNSNVPDRRYEAVQAQFNYRFAFPVFTGGTYTWSRLTGNFDGENQGSGPITANLSYPEYLAFAQSPLNSTGYLAGDVRHRARVFVGYDLATSFANVTITALENYDSGRAYDANATVDPRLSATNPGIANPGYAIPPSRVTYYFTPRGSLRTDAVTRTDLAVNLTFKVFKSLELFARPEVLNLFNEKAFYGGRLGTDSDFTVLDRANPGTNAATAFQPFNVYTTTPVQGTPGGAGVNYALGPNFGKAIAPQAYQLPRTFRFSVGVRF